MNKIAIVGTGNWSTLMHLPTFQRLQQESLVDYVGVCDINIDSAQSYADALDSVAFTSIKDMVNQQKPDGLVLIMPTTVIASVLQEVLPLEIPFFTEKPPAPDNATHQQFIQQTKDVAHVVGYNRRFSHYVQDARSWFEGHSLQSVHCQFARFNRRDEDFSTTAVHGIDTTLYLAGASLREADIYAQPCADVFSFFINGWCEGDVRIDLNISPMSGSSLEHYWVRSQARSACVRFPQNAMIDYPGSVELHEENKLCFHKTPSDYQIDESDNSILSGIYNEHKSFLDVVNGLPSPSTYASTWGTQQLRQALSDLIKSPQGGRVQLQFD